MGWHRASGNGRLGLVAACLLLGCAADGPGSGRHHSGSNDPFGNSSSAGGAGQGDFGNSGAGNAASTGGSGSAPMLPPIDPMAPPFVADDTDVAGLDANTIDQLKQGGGSCSVMLLYPYENTVFPGGLEAPLIMWDKPADAAYVHLRYDQLDSVDYQFATASSNPGELQLPREAWNEIARRTRGTALRVTLSTLAGGSVSTCETTWRVAPGNMTGALYYNTYSAPGAVNPNEGAVMRMTLGVSAAEIYLQYTGFATPGSGPCVSCHSVSANGSVIAASTHDYSAKAFAVASYPLTAAPQPAETVKLPNGAFGALTPDGKRMLTMGNPDCTAGAETFPRSKNNFPLVEGPDHAKVLDTATGQELAAPGLSPDFYMWMPQFSPNGDMVVFNHAKPDGMGGTDRRELAIMDYDYATNTFSNLRVIASHIGPEPTLPYNPGPSLSGPVPSGIGGCTANGTTAPAPIPGIPGLPGFGGDTGAFDPGTCEGPCYPAYPFFTPDGKAVVFSLTSEPDFANAFPGRDHPAKSELWYVDIETSTVLPLTNINTTLSNADLQADYFPTVLPVAVGGYYWVFWTTRRAYGHKVAGIGGDLFGLPVGAFAGGGAGGDAIKKRIWVAAIKPKTRTDDEVQASNMRVTDPSAPGFYLAGQSESGNIRAFATLNPCVTSGTTCTSGLDCCTGFCKVPPGAASGTCTDEVPECSQTNERCDSDDDCCPSNEPDTPQNFCLGGYCGFVSNTVD